VSARVSFIAGARCHALCDNRPLYEAHTIVDLVNERQVRVLVNTEFGTMIYMGSARYPGYVEVGTEFIPYNSGHLYYADATQEAISTC